MSIPFYRAFEDRYRGSRELIHERQQVYVPFLEPLKQLYPERKALDLGCGRGEWLEILVRNDFKPLGVDLDTGMLEACHALGLPVEKGDALEVLKSLPDESLTVVSGFHIAEHLPFGDLKVLVAEALRVLKPAGLLILETPNAENLVVGTQTFYLDPTHERPIPHLLLGFLTEYSGFNRCQLLRLQESAALAEGGPVDLMSVLHGVSPDYAVIAQKQALPEQLEIFDAVFARDYGLSLETLARRYDAQLAHWIEQGDASTVQLREQLNQAQHHSQQLETVVHELGGRSDNNHLEVQNQLRELGLRTEQAESRFQSYELRLNQAFATIERVQAEAELKLDEASAVNERVQAAAGLQLNEALAAIERVQTQVEHLLQGARGQEAIEQSVAQSDLQELNARLTESLNNAHHWWLQANAYEAQIAALVNSRSWRITQPLRASSSLFGGAMKLPRHMTKRVIRSLLARSIRFVLDRPRLRLRISNKIKSYPELFGRMRQFALRHGIMQPQPDDLSPAVAPTEASEDGFLTASPRVARIYSELKLAFERKENR
jgi:O-antigen chain-terminating methyltransferase